MQICHIASHKGNVGDLINHQGFYNNMLPAEVSANIENHDPVVGEVFRNEAELEDNGQTHINTLHLIKLLMPVVVVKATYIKSE